MDQKYSRCRHYTCRHKTEWLQTRAEILHNEDVAQAHGNCGQDHNQK
jgi:hypothetical protein